MDGGVSFVSHSESSATVGGSTAADGAGTPSSADADAVFTNFARDASRAARVLAKPPLDAFPGGGGLAGLEPLLSLVADVLDMDLVLVGHVNGDTYTATASYSRRSDLQFPKGGTIPILETYCCEEIVAGAPFAIADAEHDPRYRDHPGYTKLGLRSYVGAPLVLEDGTLYGTLCGTDTLPKTVDHEQVERLLILAGTLSVEISRRLGLKSATEIERALARANSHLHDYTRRLAHTAVERGERARLLSVELRDANRRQEETIKRLRSANDELREFTYTVAHDLSEPLRGVETMAGYVEESAAAAGVPHLLEDARRIRWNALRLKDRIRGILEFSRNMRAEFDVTDVDSGECVRRVLDEVGERAAAAGAIVHAPESGFPLVRTERVRLEQALLILVDNAIKYNADRNVRIDIGCRDTGDAWEFFVEDDGVGVPPAYRDRVFGVFQRGPLAHEYGGSGVGLAIVRRFAERDGGRAWMDESKSGGAVVRFTLPHAPAVH